MLKFLNSLTCSAFSIGGQSHGELAEPSIMPEILGTELDEAPKYGSKLF